MKKTGSLCGCHALCFVMYHQADRVDFPESRWLIDNIGIVQVIVKSFLHGLLPPQGYE